MVEHILGHFGKICHQLEGQRERSLVSLVPEERGEGVRGFVSRFELGRLLSQFKSKYYSSC